MNRKNEFELIVSEGRRPIWKLIIASLFFTAFFYFLYEVVLLFWKIGFNENVTNILPASIKVLAYSFTGGVAFSVTKTVLIDVDRDKLISRYCVGPFSKDVLSIVPQLEYVSVFLNSKEEFEVNLWYKGNKHYNMYYFDEKFSAFQFAEQVAVKLNIDLLDATEKGNSKWTDKAVL